MTDYSKFVPDLIVGWQQHDAELAELRALLATGKDHSMPANDAYHPTSPRRRSAVSETAAKFADESRLAGARGRSEHAAPRRARRLTRTRSTERDADRAAARARRFVNRPNVFNFETSYNFQVGGTVTAAGDPDIESQLMTDWNKMAGVIA